MQKTCDPVDKDVSKSDVENLNDSRWVISYFSFYNTYFHFKIRTITKLLS